MGHIKKGIAAAVLLAAVCSFAPSFASAVSITDLQAQIDALLAQMRTLQAQLAAQQGAGTTGSGGSASSTAQSSSTSLRVIIPNGGETYQKGETIKYGWYQDYKRSRLLLTLTNFDTGVAYYSARLTGKPGSNTGAMSGEAVSVPAGKYRITICDKSRQVYDTNPTYKPAAALCDTSDAPFTITASAASSTPATPFAFTFPYANAALVTGKTYTVAWRGENQGVSSYPVYLVGGPLNNGQIFLGYAAASQHSFAWTLSSSLQAGGGYKLAFRLPQNGGAQESPAFSIVRPSGSVTPLSQITSSEKFVKNLYKTFYLREPASSDSGLRFWVDSFNNGQPVTELYRAFLRAGEFAQARQSISNRDYVKLMYQTVLFRDADSSGLDFWTSELDSGRKNKESMLTAFLVSGEFVDDIAPRLSSLQ